MKTSTEIIYKISSGLMVVIILEVTVIAVMQFGLSMKLSRLFIIITPLSLIAFLLWRQVRRVKYILLLASGLIVYAFVDDLRHNRLTELVLKPKFLAAICSIVLPILMATVLLFFARGKNMKDTDDTLDKHLAEPPEEKN